MTCSIFSALLRRQYYLCVLIILQYKSTYILCYQRVINIKLSYNEQFNFAEELDALEEYAAVDVNAYAHKKTLAQGMMDLALLTANANQLRYVVETYKNHPYFYPSLVLLILSIGFQVSYAFIYPYIHSADNFIFSNFSDSRWRWLDTQQPLQY